MIIPALRPPITTACPMCADLIRHGGWNAWWVSGARIPTRGCPHQCGYCTIPLMYPKALRMRLRPVDEVAQHRFRSAVHHCLSCIAPSGR